MKKPALLTFALLFGTSTLAETPWEKYLLDPTPENARLVSEIEYLGDSNNFDFDLRLLEVQVQSGDAEAFELALRLAEQADGGDLHDLKVVASRAIRSHPTIVLTQAESNPRFAGLIQGILVTVGEEYVDRPVARRYELQARRDVIANAALDTDNVNTAELLEVLDEEIKALDWATTNDL